MQAGPATTAQPPRLSADLERVLPGCEGPLRHLDGGRILVTGGTGFVGSWLLELLTWGVDRMALAVKVVAVTRDPARFAAHRPHLAGHRSVELRRGDVRAAHADGEVFDFVIAGAAASAASGDARSEGDVADVQRANAALARHHLDRSDARVLLLSSGAARAAATDAYARAKRDAEDVVTAAGGRAATVARLFAFVGPYLPLELNFAAGNFLGDALAGRPVRVRGDGSPTRTYLYPADLAAWLWTILVGGRPGTRYDVGSAEAVTVAELARRVAALADPPVGVVIEGGAVASSAEDRYVPDLTAAARLGLLSNWTLDEALARTFHWHRAMLAR